MKVNDLKIEELWDELGDIPFDDDPEDEMVLADDFHIFTKRTPRYNIWHWFDEKHSNGVAYLLGVNI